MGGCGYRIGRFGQKLASPWRWQRGHRHRPEPGPGGLDSRPGGTPCGNGTDIEALKAQGIDKVDVAIVWVGKARPRIRISGLTVVNLRQLGVEQIIPGPRV
jgi:hypothetical protein